MSQSRTASKDQFDKVIERPETEGGQVVLDVQSSRQDGVSSVTHVLDGVSRHVQKQEGVSKMQVSQFDADRSVLDPHQESDKQLHSERVWQGEKAQDEDSMQGRGLQPARSSIDVANQRALKDLLNQGCEGERPQRPGDERGGRDAQAHVSMRDINQIEDKMSRENGLEGIGMPFAPDQQNIEQNKQDKSKDDTQNRQTGSRKEIVVQSVSDEEKSFQDGTQNFGGPQAAEVQNDAPPEGLESDQLDSLNDRKNDDQNDEIVKYAPEEPSLASGQDQAAKGQTYRSNTVDRPTDNLELEHLNEHGKTFQILVNDNDECMDAVQLQFSDRSVNANLAAVKSPGQSVKVVSRRSTRRGSNLAIETKQREDYMKQTEQNKKEVTITPGDSNDQKLGNDINENIKLSQRGRNQFNRNQLTISPKRRGSPSMRSEQSIQEIMSADSVKFRRAIEGKISGMLDMDLRRNQAKKDSQQFQNFLSREVISQTSSEDEDDYSPIKLQKHIPASDLFKDLLNRKMDPTEFDQPSDQEYYPFFENNHSELMNTPVQRGKALWAFIFNAMRQRPRFEKMKSVINKANNQPVTHEQIEKRKSLEEYLKIQAKKVIGETPPDETQVYSIKDHSLLLENEPSLSLAQTLSFRQMDGLRMQMEKLFKMNQHDEQEFTSLKKVIGYKHPRQKIMERIKRQQADEAMNKLQRALQKEMNSMNKDKPNASMKPLTPEEKLLLVRQEQLIKLHEEAKPKVDQKWESNPFKSYQLKLIKQGNDRTNINWVARNIGKYSRHRASKHAVSPQDDLNDRVVLSPKQDRRSSQMNQSSVSRVTSYLRHHNNVPADTHGKDRESRDSTDQMYNSFNRRQGDVKSDDELRARPMHAESQHGSRPSKEMLLKFSYKSPTLTNGNESCYLPDITSQNTTGSRMKVVKSAVDMANLFNAFQEKHGIEPDDLPLEIIKLLIERFDFYQTKIHRQLNVFKDKLLRVRLKEIQKTHNTGFQNLNTEPNEEGETRNLDTQCRINTSTGNGTENNDSLPLQIDENLAMQLDDSFMRSNQQLNANLQSTNSLTYDLAQNLIANIEMIPKARKVRRLKAELHMIVQRYLMLRSLIQKLNETVLENHRLHEEEIKNKALSPQSSSLLLSASKMDGHQSQFRPADADTVPSLVMQYRIFHMPKEIELEAEKVKIMFDPQFSPKDHDRNPTEEQEKKRVAEAVPFQEITSVIYPALKLLAKFSAKKVQSDFSFRIILEQKMMKMYLGLIKLNQAKDSEVLFKIQENDFMQNSSDMAEGPLVDIHAKQSGMYADVSPANLDNGVFYSAAQERGVLSQADVKQNDEDAWNHQQVSSSYNLESSPEVQKNDLSKPKRILSDQQVFNQRSYTKSAQNVRANYSKRRPERIEFQKINLNPNVAVDAANFSANKVRLHTNQGPRPKLDESRLNTKPTNELFDLRQKPSLDNSAVFMKRRIRKGNRRYGWGAAHSSIINNEDASFGLFTPQNQRVQTNSCLQTIDTQKFMTNKYQIQNQSGTGTITNDNTAMFSPMSGKSGYGSTGISINVRRKLHKYISKQSRDDCQRNAKLNDDTMLTQFLKNPANKSSLKINNRTNFTSLLEKKQNHLTQKSIGKAMSPHKKLYIQSQLYSFQYLTDHRAKVEN